MYIFDICTKTFKKRRMRHNLPITKRPWRSLFIYLSSLAAPILPTPGVWPFIKYRATGTGLLFADALIYRSAKKTESYVECHQCEYQKCFWWRVSVTSSDRVQRRYHCTQHQNTRPHSHSTTIAARWRSCEGLVRITSRHYCYTLHNKHGYTFNVSFSVSLPPSLRSENFPKKLLAQLTKKVGYSRG